MKWFVIALAMFASAAIVALSASADRKGAPSAQAKAAAKAQVKAAKQQRAAAKAVFKRDLANAKAGLKAPKADLKAAKAALKRALREEAQLEKASTKADKAVAAAAAAVGATRPPTAQALADRDAAQKTASDTWASWQAARKATEDRRGDLQNAKQKMFNAKAEVGYKKYLIHTLPPVGKPVFNKNGVLQLKAVDYVVYAATPSLQKVLFPRPPASGPVAPAEPDAPKMKLPAGISPPPSGAQVIAPPEPPLTRAALTVARAESPYQIIPMSVFKQNAAAQ